MALIDGGEIDSGEFDRLVAETYREVTGADLPEFARQSCRVPLLMARAPVYPSTKSGD